MKIVSRNVALLIIVAALSGCFYSDEQLSNDFNAAKPLPNLISATQYNLVSGNWKKQDIQHLIRKNDFEFVYRASRKGSKDFKEQQFALLPLGGRYYAMETPGKSPKGKGKFRYAILEIRQDRVLRWEFDKVFMKSIDSNVSLQRRLGVSCFDEGECKIDSIADLKNILAYVLNQDVAATILYRFDS